MENFGDVESRGYYANIWELTAIWLVRFLLRRSKLQAIQFFRLERLTHSRFSRSIIQCDFDSVGVRESVSVQLVRVIFFFYKRKWNGVSKLDTIFSRLQSSLCVSRRASSCLCPYKVKKMK